MEFEVDIYEIEKNGRCKANLRIADINLYISGFRIVPGTNGKGVIVHTPKGMGTDWKYKEIEWEKVREIISEQYLQNPQIIEIYSRLAVEQMSISSAMETKTVNQKVSKGVVDLFVNLYDFNSEADTCQASVILPNKRIRVEGFGVKQIGKGIQVYMPKKMGISWPFDEVTWKEVQKSIAEKYRREKQYLEATVLEREDGFRVSFHSYIEEAQYHMLIRNRNQTVGRAILNVKDENYMVEVDDETLQVLEPYEIRKKELEELCKSAFENEMFLSEEQNDLYVEGEVCIGFTRNVLVDFILPGSGHEWINFCIKETNDGEVFVSTPSNMTERWENKQYPWKKLCGILQEEYKKFKIKKLSEDNKMKTEARRSETIKKDTHQIQEETAEIKKEMSEKKKQNLDMKNQLGRIRNAENTAFIFMPHTILKLMPFKYENNLSQKLVQALNNPNGGIGEFEIELLDWVSKLKYVSKTIILDLVLSGYISMGNRKKITADKMTAVMNRLYKYNLIEMSRFICTDDDESMEENKRAVYRIYTLGGMGYSLLKEMGRHPERRNPFGVLADGNTVKKHLAANQWLGYWLTHYSADDILDYSINTIIKQMGQWNGAKIYAGVTLDSVSFVAEPVRRCEEFEKEDSRIELRKKLSRMIELFDNRDQLYSSKREQVVLSTRPIITYIGEDDAHIKEILESIEDILEEKPQQEVWFTTDLRMFNYNDVGRRFLILEDGELLILDLEKKIGIREMTMEERGKQ